MRFPNMFTRTVGGGGTALGSDSAPTQASDLAKDNAAAYRPYNNNGFPVQRIVVGYHGPAGAKPLPATLWLREEQSDSWFQIAASAATLMPEALTTFDVPALMDNAALSKAGPDGAIVGALDLVLVIETAGADPDGTYTFVWGADVSGQGVL